ncbi:dedicator of cytokinesis [Kipferlia bialata]|uniref:Dedicator of cytokinesis n=1 Tax=Kipferlia bialata TaxID=797122 RepID=A0A9K3CN88_9EUKA|nr:dedicator of cytokinesis [Kipferlia bialata]|eukprot:g925.t1
MRGDVSPSVSRPCLLWDRAVSTAQMDTRTTGSVPLLNALHPVSSLAARHHTTNPAPLPTRRCLRVVVAVDKLVPPRGALIEPFWGNLCLLDIESGERVSESFQFNVNDNHITQMMYPKATDQGASLSRVAVFEIPEPSTSLVLAVRFERSLAGEADDTADMYQTVDRVGVSDPKASKTVQTFHAKMKTGLRRLGAVREVFIWGYTPVFAEGEPERGVDTFKFLLGADSTVVTSPKHHSPLSPSVRRPFPTPQSDAALTKDGAVHTMGTFYMAKQHGNYGDHSLVESIREITRENKEPRRLPFSFNLRCRMLTGEDALFNALPLMSPSRVPLGGSDEALTTVLGTDDFSGSLVRVMDWVGPQDGAFAVPEREFVNDMLVSPQGVNLSRYSYSGRSCRNIVVSVELRDNDDLGKEAMQAIYPPYHGHVQGNSGTGGRGHRRTVSKEKESVAEAGWTRESDGLQRMYVTSGTYHHKTPEMGDEVRVRLPLQVTPRHHLLFTLYHVSVKDKAKRSLSDFPSDQMPALLGPCDDTLRGTDCDPALLGASQRGGANGARLSAPSLSLVGYVVVPLYQNDRGERLRLVPKGVQGYPLYGDLPANYMSRLRERDTDTLLCKGENVFDVSVVSRSLLYPQDAGIAGLYQAYGDVKGLADLARKMQPGTGSLTSPSRSTRMESMRLSSKLAQEIDFPSIVGKISDMPDFSRTLVTTLNILFGSLQLLNAAQRADQSAGLFRAVLTVLSKTDDAAAAHMLGVMESVDEGEGAQSTQTSTGTGSQPGAAEAASTFSFGVSLSASEESLNPLLESYLAHHFLPPVRRGWAEAMLEAWTQYGQSASADADGQRLLAEKAPFLFGLVVRSLVVEASVGSGVAHSPVGTSLPNLSASPLDCSESRKGRFPPSLYSALHSVVEQTAEWVADQIDRMQQHGKLLSRAMGRFLADLSEVVDRRQVFLMVQLFTDTVLSGGLVDDKRGSLRTQDIKRASHFEPVSLLLREMLCHPNAVALSLPLLRPLGAKAPRSRSRAKGDAPRKLSRSDSSASLLDAMQSRMAKYHFLPSALIQHVEMSLAGGVGAKEQGAALLLETLSLVDADKRYADTRKTESIAAMYAPIICIPLDNAPLAFNLDAAPDAKPESLETRPGTELSLLGCMLWVLGGLSESSLTHILTVLSPDQKATLTKVLARCLVVMGHTQLTAASKSTSQADTSVASKLGALSTMYQSKGRQRQRRATQGASGPGSTRSVRLSQGGQGLSQSRAGSMRSMSTAGGQRPGSMSMSMSMAGPQRRESMAARGHGSHSRNSNWGMQSYRGEGERELLISPKETKRRALLVGHVCSSATTYVLKVLETLINVCPETLSLENVSPLRTSAFSLLASVLSMPNSVPAVRRALDLLIRLASVAGPLFLSGRFEPGLEVVRKSIDLFSRHTREYRQCSAAFLYTLLRDEYLQSGGDSGVKGFPHTVTLATDCIYRLTPVNGSFEASYLSCSLSSLVAYAKAEADSPTTPVAVDDGFMSCMDRFVDAMSGVIADSREIVAKATVRRVNPSDGTQLPPIEDEELLADLHLSRADGYKHTPSVRATVLGVLAAHLSSTDPAKPRHHHAEAGLVSLLEAALISEGVRFPGTDSDPACWQWYSMHSDKSSLFRTVVGTEKEGADGVCVADSLIGELRQVLPWLSHQIPSHTDMRPESLLEWNGERVVRRLREGAALLAKAGLHEMAMVPLRSALSLLSRVGDWEAAGEVGQTLAKVCADAARDRADTHRSLGTFYMVGMYGKVLGDDNGSVFIYMEPRLTRGDAVRARLKQFLEGQHPNSVVAFKTGSRVPAEEWYTHSDVTVQIHEVKPFGDRAPASDPYRSVVGATQFSYTTIFTRSGSKKIEDALEDVCRRRTVLTVKHPFPYLVSRQAVVDREVTEFSPLQSAVVLCEEQTAKLVSQTTAPNPDLNSLQLVLQGSVMPQINSGLLPPARIFLHNTDYSEDDRLALHAALCGFLDSASDAIKLGRRLVAGVPALLEFHEQLEKGFRSLTHSLALLLNGTSAQGWLDRAELETVADRMTESQSAQMMSQSMGPAQVQQLAQSMAGGDGRAERARGARPQSSRLRDAPLSLNHL